MKTANLKANIITQRGGNSQATAALYLLGSASGGTNSVARVGKLETQFGGGRKNIKTRAWTVGDLKRFLRKTGGNINGLAGLIGRD